METLEVAPVAVPQSESRLLGIQQAATYLGCTVWAVRSLIWERKIPSLKLGKRLLLDRTDLDSFIDSHKRGVRH